MTEKKFLAFNKQLRQRQAAIRRAREQTDPVHISRILPDVMAEIQRRCMKRERVGETL